jgi:hypothetical protein
VSHVNFRSGWISAAPVFDPHVMLGSQAVINGQRDQVPKTAPVSALALVDGGSGVGQLASGEIFPVTSTWFGVGIIVKILVLKASAPFPRG